MIVVTKHSLCTLEQVTLSLVFQVCLSVFLCVCKLYAVTFNLYKKERVFIIGMRIPDSFRWHHLQPVCELDLDPKWPMTFFYTCHWKWHLTKNIWVDSNVWPSSLSSRDSVLCVTCLYIVLIGITKTVTKVTNIRMDRETDGQHTNWWGKAEAKIVKKDATFGKMN